MLVQRGSDRPCAETMRPGLTILAMPLVRSDLVPVRHFGCQKANAITSCINISLIIVIEPISIEINFCLSIMSAYLSIRNWLMQLQRLSE